MAHQHSVYDTDPHFKIDSFSRAIIDLSEKQTKLMQGDHNSERFTFEIDRRVDGHDMTQCDRVEVHYLNVDGSTKDSIGDVYEVDDVSTSPVSDSVVIFSWLVSKNATGYAGTLNFRIRFVCTDESGNVVYAWHTDIFKGITVSSGISNTAAVVEEYSDVLAKWERDLFEQGSTSVANVNVARDAAITAVQEEGAAQIAAVEAKGAETLESIPDDFSAVAAEAEANTAAIEEVDKHRAALESRSNRQGKLLRNLSQAIQNATDGITPDPYDNTPAFTRDVPANALPFAEVVEIGGVTRKCSNYLKLPYAGGDTKTTYGITFTAKPDGGITIDGTNTHTTYVEYPLITTNALILTDSKVTVSLFGAASEDIYCTVGGGGFAFNEVKSGTSSTLANNGTTNIFSYGLLRVKVGATVSKVTVYPMLNSGETALPYEPYFSGLRSAPVSEVVSEGENLFDGDEVINVDGYKQIKLPNPLPPGTYYVSAMVSSTDTDTTSTRLGFLSGSNNYYVTFYRQNKIEKNTINIPATVTSVRLLSGYSIANSEGDTSVWTKLQIERNKFTDYKPYRVHTFPIPEAVKALPDYGVGIPNTDYLNRIRWRYDEQADKWVREYHRPMKTVDMGTLNWQLFSGGVYYADIADIEIASTLSKRVVGIMCGIYALSSNLDYTIMTNKAVMRNSKANQVFVRDDDYATAAELKAALSGVTFVYPLATPEITDISDILPEDNLLGVEAGGTITAENEFGYAVPMTIK